MNNDEVYAQGLLNRALDPATQPAAIQSFLRKESELLRELIPQGSRVIDFGCGTGRHLHSLSDHISEGVGLDYEAAHIAEAAKLTAAPHLRFLVADASAVPLTETFDVAMCLTNTLGTMSDKSAVLDEMKRLAPGDARSEWYANLGHNVLHATDQQIVAAGGFTSEHVDEDRLRGLLGPCELHRIADIAYVARC